MSKDTSATPGAHRGIFLGNLRLLTEKAAEDLQHDPKKFVAV